MSIWRTLVFALSSSAILASCENLPSQDAVSVQDEETRQIISELRSRKPVTRTEAANRAGTLRISAVAPHLARLLSDDELFYCGEDPNGHVMQCSAGEVAMESLVEIGPDAIVPLSQAMKNPLSIVRQRAAYALARIENPQTIDPLLKALRDRDPSVRLAALTWLDRADDRLLEEIIRILSHDRDDSVRWEASKSLQTYSDHPRAVQAAIAALSDKTIDVQAYAMIALGRVKDPAALEAMIDVLDDAKRSGHVRVYAALNLGRWTDEKSYAALLRASTSSDWDTRSGALRALGERKDKRGVQPLLSALSSEVFAERAMAAEALGLIGDPQALEPLRVLLSDPQPVVRDAAAKARKEIEGIGSR